MTGKFVTEWQNVLKDSGADVKEVDVALGVSALLAVKDSEELVRMPFPASRASRREKAHKSDSAAKRTQRDDHDEQADEPL